MKQLSNDELFSLGGGFKEEACSFLAGVGLGIAIFDIVVPPAAAITLAIAGVACL